ncbi:MAG: hypothetical protein AAGM38_06935 [Pseudomonadota bacterium]
MTARHFETEPHWRRTGAARLLGGLALGAALGLGSAASATETPEAEAPATEIPSAEVPTAEVPTAEVLNPEGPTAEAPAAATPAEETAAAETQQPPRIEIRGEMIDTWCYFSGVMGGEDAVVGSAHHTCALWCAAGGIPVGLLTEEGEVYMVLKVENDDHVAGGDTVLDLQSDVIRADGLVYVRDGVKYLVVEEVLANEGIQTLNHEDYGPVPPFAFPEPN